VLGPVEARIDSELQSVERPARDRVSDAMNSSRYLDILKTLRRWSTQPPIAGPVSTKDLYKQVRRAKRKADRRLAAGIALIFCPFSAFLFQGGPLRPARNRNIEKHRTRERGSTSSQFRCRSTSQLSAHAA
jgi:hypothetical protein